MSASLILGGIGAIIGGLITWNPAGVAAGFAIGSAIGAVAFPPKRPDIPSVVGPKLDDLRVSSADPGAPIPLCFGSCRLAGTVIWSTGLGETTHTETITGGGGASKGGGGAKPGSSTTYSYSTNVAVLVCEGPVDGIGRIWADEAKLVRDFVGFKAATGVPTCTDTDISTYRSAVEPWLLRQGYGADPAAQTLYNLNRIALATSAPVDDPRPILDCGYTIGGSGSTTNLPPGTIGSYDNPSPTS